MKRLSKKLCRRCYRERHEVWNPIDEGNWAMGKVCCGIHNGVNLISFTQFEAKGHCRYQLEHMMLDNRWKRKKKNVRQNYV